MATWTVELDGVRHRLGVGFVFGYLTLYLDGANVARQLRLADFETTGIVGIEHDLLGHHIEARATLVRWRRLIWWFGGPRYALFVGGSPQPGSYLGPPVGMPDAQ